MHPTRHLFLSFWRWLWLGFLLMALRPAAAATPEALFAQANRAYSDRQYEQAIALYDSIVQDQGLASADLYFNLGNAHYQLQHLAPALLAYERALRLDPTHTDALFNRRLASLKVVDNIEPQPEFVLTRWWRETVSSRSAAQWGLVAMGLLWAVVAAVAVLFFVPRPQVRRVAFVSGIVLATLSVGCLMLGISRYQASQSEQYGLIMTPNAYVKNAPGGETDLLILHEGVKVRLLDQVDEWTQIELDGANIGEVRGFVRTKTLAVI
jgi:tetratricopeptide (TPR) repeat protein